ncbi:hypothetical protein V6N12_009713 [Hibiscus sabdariffa]|uniref:RNase H type-1 domain-containing protein n=1 Tax=Hibiscus sabdariffa TaxID=183260 RepID=A0ABR2AHR1_9ROSI
MGEETVDHVLRHCKVATSIWRRVRIGSSYANFMALPFVNIRNQGDRVFPGRNWDVLFPTICWQLWKRWCNVLLDANYNEVEDLLVKSFRLADEFAVELAGSNVRSAPFQSRRPNRGWFKVNADGAHNIHNGNTAAGGVIRDDHGFWVVGFSKSLGVNGRDLLGISRPELETDNVEVERILNGTTETFMGNAIVAEIRELLDRNWMVRIMCVRRDMNAPMARDKPVGEVIFTSAPVEVSTLISLVTCWIIQCC